MKKTYLLLFVVLFSAVVSLEVSATDHGFTSIAEDNSLGGGPSTCDLTSGACYIQEKEEYGVAPFSSEGFSFFPQYLAEFYDTGVRSVYNGEIGYMLETIDVDEAGKIIHFCCGSLYKHQEFLRLEKEIKSLVAMRGLGSQTYFQLPIANSWSFMITSDAAVQKRWIKAMKYLGRSLLEVKSESAFGENGEALIKVLKMAHNKLISNSRGKDLFYRDKPVVVLPQPSLEHTLLFKQRYGKVPEQTINWLQALELEGVSKDEIKIISDNVKILYNPEAYELLSDEIKKIITKYISITPRPEMLPGLMADFARQFKDKWKLVEQGKIHPISFAAWTHMTIVNIHPFEDGNGKLARLWMDAVLLKNGYLAPILNYERDYLDAVNKDRNGEHGAFAIYLAKQIQETQDNEFLLDLSLENIAKISDKVK